MKIDVIHENSTISFIHLKKRNIKNIYIVVDKKNGVVLKSGTYLKKDEAEKIILGKAEWIKERLDSVKNSISTQIPSTENLDCLFFKNMKISLQTKKDIGIKNLHLSFENNMISIKYHPKKYKNIQKAIEDFYEEQTKKIVFYAVEKFSELMAMNPNEVRFKKYKRRWGCCDIRNNITFNTSLSQFSDEIVEYIVVHELAHIKEKNHSKKFWEIVKKYKPDYKEIHKKMRAVH